MININKLKGKMMENEKTAEICAAALNIDISSFYRKLNKAKGETFTIKEAQILVKLLSLSGEEAISIFFADTVA